MANLPLYHNLRTCIVDGLLQINSFNSNNITLMPSVYGTVHSIIPTIQDNLDEFLKKSKLYYGFIEAINLTLLFVYIDDEIDITGKERMFHIRSIESNKLVIFLHHNIGTDEKFKIILEILDIIHDHYLYRDKIETVVAQYAKILVPYSVLSYNINDPQFGTKDEYIDMAVKLIDKSLPKDKIKEIIDLLKDYSLTELLDNYYIIQQHKEYELNGDDVYELY